MEGVKNEIRRQIIMNFYQKNFEKGKIYTVKYFKKLDVTSKQVYRAIARVERRESHLQQKGARAPRKLSKAQEKQVVKSIKTNILMTANEGPYSTFH